MPFGGSGTFGPKHGSLPVPDLRISVERRAAPEIRFTTCKLKPRAGTTAVWLDELADLLSAMKCGHILEEAGPPTLLDIQSQLSTPDTHLHTLVPPS